MRWVLFMTVLCMVGCPDPSGPGGGGGGGILPDLVIENVEVGGISKSIDCYQMSVTVEIKNIGNVPLMANKKFAVTMYLRMKAAGDDPHALIARCYFDRFPTALNEGKKKFIVKGPIKVMGVKKVELNVYFFTMWKNEALELVTVVDSGKKIKEKNENNNQYICDFPFKAY